MEQSLTLLSAQVHFLETELALIHIPLRLYNAFLQPILHLLMPPKASDAFSSDNYADANEHAFLNISITPYECSVACPRHLANHLFVPVRDELNANIRKDVVISKDDYIVMQVDGEGLVAGQRVVELTAPLAMNGISIFFISTYFSDYILVPVQSRSTVIEALEARGFAFESQTEAFVNVSSPSASSSRHNSAIFNRNLSCSTASLENPFDRIFSTPTSPTSQRPPPTPPPSSLKELQSRTFATLKRRNIVPQADPSIRLVQCAERKPTVRGSSELPEACAARATTQLRMHTALTQCLITLPRPRFLSLTLTNTEAASLLLERRLLPNFEASAPAMGAQASLLLGDPDEVLVPIVLDLRELPMESTGIVCGVAGRLVAGVSQDVDEDEDDEGYQGASVKITDGGVLEMSYLSTARAGTVIVTELALERAMRALATETGAV